MMEKVDLKRAKFSGILDVLGFLAGARHDGGLYRNRSCQSDGASRGRQTPGKRSETEWKKRLTACFSIGWEKFPIIPHCCLPLFSGFWPCCFCLWRLRLSVREIPC